MHQQIASLTPREHEVMALLLDGLSTKLIARQLAVSPRTVEIHRSRVLHKLNVENAQQLVGKVIKSTA